MVGYNFMVSVCLPRRNKRKRLKKTLWWMFSPSHFRKPQRIHTHKQTTKYELNEVIFWFIKSQTVNLTIFIHLNYGSNQVISIKYACGTLYSILSQRLLLCSQSIACEKHHPIVQKKTYNFFITAIRTLSLWTYMALLLLYCQSSICSYYIQFSSLYSFIHSFRWYLIWA